MNNAGVDTSQSMEPLVVIYWRPPSNYKVPINGNKNWSERQLGRVSYFNLKFYYVSLKLRIHQPCCNDTSVLSKNT